jgi:hypothetical protein
MAGRTRRYTRRGSNQEQAQVRARSNEGDVSAGGHFGLWRFRVRSDPAKRKRIDDLTSSMAQAASQMPLQRRAVEGCCPLEHKPGRLPALAT